jgi:hypothetical protein
MHIVYFLHIKLLLKRYRPTHIGQCLKKYYVRLDLIDIMYVDDTLTYS